MQNGRQVNSGLGSFKIFSSRCEGCLVVIPIWYTSPLMHSAIKFDLKIIWDFEEDCLKRERNNR
jgi:hypothetical protein